MCLPRCQPTLSLVGSPPAHINNFWRQTMTWETPTACDLRFGFEITMYIAVR